ncbi:unnamed protein product, partial [Choristocarpus tenellus]
YAPHPWEGDPHRDTSTVGLACRIEEVLRLRTIREELGRLLGGKGGKWGGSPEDLFKSFQSVAPLVYNPYTLDEWKTAVSGFELSLAPLEDAAAAKFRRHVSGMMARPQLLLREFQRFANLLRRPRIQDALSSEREALLNQLIEYMAELEAKFDDRDLSSRLCSSGATPAEGLPWGRNLSPRVRGVVYCRQLSARVKATRGTATALLSDLSAFRVFEDLSHELTRKAHRQESALYEDWQEEVQDSLDGEELSTQMCGKARYQLQNWFLASNPILLMDINKAGILVVNFSGRLVTLLREVRQLAELGHPIPGKIVKVAQEGEKYYRYGVMLKKVANFYNNMSSQVIPVQRPMLLGSLLAFEEVVMQPTLARKDKSGRTRGSSSVTWTNPVECENYVERLQQAADTLSMENRRLRKVHASLASLVSGMMSVDLLRQRDRWKSCWGQVREVMAGMKAKYPNSSMERWVEFWDHQIFKALEAGYQMGLESLNENLPEVRAELVIALRSVQFKPPLEELRSSYYREMKKFVGIPNAFEGLGNTQVYREMAPANSQFLLRVFEKAEDIFQRLANLLERYKVWAVLALVDLDSYVDKHITSVEGYEHNFRALRARRKEAEKLPENIKARPLTSIKTMPLAFINNLFPFKASLEDQFQRLADALTLSLRKVVLTNFKAVDVYLEESMEKLSRRPRTVAEIGQAKKDWKEVDEGKDTLRKLSTKTVAMKELLLQHAPGNQVDTSEVVTKMAGLEGEGGRWDEFEVAAEAFHDIVEEQKESLKGVLEEEAMQLNQAIDKFGQRWQALKPQEMKEWSPAEVSRVYSSLEDWREQFQEHKGKAEALKENCTSFGMPVVRFEGLEVIEEDLAACENSWGMYKEFSEELKALADQDWISFRQNVFALQDLGSKWGEKIKARLAEAQRADTVTEHVHKELERIRKATPALKYCRGEPFKEEHWSALLQGKLGLERSVRLENLMVGHFISALDRLADPSLLQFVKHLQSRAQGEVTIREALQELVAWSQTAELKLADHEQNGRRTALIRDW